MNRATWTAHLWLRRIGWPGVVGLVLLLAGAAFAAAIYSRSNTLAQVQQEVSSLRTRYRMELSHPAALKPGREQQLQTFYEFFPRPSALPDWLTQIYNAAESAGLKLDAVDYKLSQEKGAKLARYELTLPVSGGYTQVRTFIAAVLRDVPAAALEDIVLKRDAIGSTTVEARIKLVLFLRKAYA